jgi:hypothetical protein
MITFTWRFLGVKTEEAEKIKYSYPGIYFILISSEEVLVTS